MPSYAKELLAVAGSYAKAIEAGRKERAGCVASSRSNVSRLLEPLMVPRRVPWIFSMRTESSSRGQGGLFHAAFQDQFFQFQSVVARPPRRVGCVGCFGCFGERSQAHLQLKVFQETPRKKRQEVLARFGLERCRPEVLKALYRGFLDKNLPVLMEPQGVAVWAVCLVCCLVCVFPDSSLCLDGHIGQTKTELDSREPPRTRLACPSVCSSRRVPDCAPRGVLQNVFRPETLKAVPGARLQKRF